jgi:hypothetical protein
LEGNKREANKLYYKQTSGGRKSRRKEEKEIKSFLSIEFIHKSLLMFFTGR